MKPAASSVRAQRGFSMVELMVAAMIGLIGTIVIFQVFAVFEGQKRTTTSSGDAQQNGLLALVSLEREARMAGYGLSYVPLLGCNTAAYDATGARDFNFLLTALQLTEGAAGGPDQITMLYGSSNSLVAPPKLLVSSAVGALSTRVNNAYGYQGPAGGQPGDVIIVGEAGKNCSMRQISSIVGDTLNHDGVDRYNKAGGLPVAYSVWDNTSQSGGVAYTLGRAPVLSTYSLGRSDGNAALPSEELMFVNTFLGTTTTSIVDSIVQFQAQYGFDENGNGVLEATEWRDPCPNPAELPKGGPPAVCAAATATDWSRVLSVRLAVVARSMQPERPDPATGVCNTTAAALPWTGGNIVLTGYVGAEPNWQCYRYRVFETSVPVRNLIWTPQ